MEETKENIQNYVSKYGGEYLGLEVYKRIRHHKLRCKNGHEFYIRRGNLIKRSIFCKQCSIDEEVNKVTEYVINNEGVVLEETRKGSHRYFTIECKNGHKQDINIKSIKRKTFCVQCDKNEEMEILQEYLDKNEGTLVERVSTSKYVIYKILCKNKHELEFRKGRLTETVFCRQCDYDYYHAYALSNDGDLLREFYKDKCTWYEFRCKNEHVFSVRKDAIENRTFFCNECIPSREEKLKVYGESANKGDELELFVQNIYEENGYEVERLGQTGDIFDLTVIVDGIGRGIQVKMLSKKIERKNGTTCFYLHRDYKYPNNLLIVAISEDRKYWYIEFFRDCKGYIIFDRESDINEQIKKLFSLTELSTDVSTLTMDERLSERHLIEQRMIDRLIKYCKRYDLEFKREVSEKSQVDCYINGYRVQCKFTSVKDYNSYRTHIHKRISKKSVPYDYNDFDFLVVEIKDFPGEFCCLSKEELNEKGYFSKTKIWIFHSTAKTRGNFTKDEKNWDLKSKITPT